MGARFYVRGLRFITDADLPDDGGKAQTAPAAIEADDPYDLDGVDFDTDLDAA